MNPDELIEMFVSLLVMLIILDIFFLGWFLVDEPVLKTIAEGMSSIVPLLLVDTKFGDKNAG